MKNPIRILIIIGIYLILFFTACKNPATTEEFAPEVKVDSVYSWLTNMQQANGLLLSSEGGRLVSLYDNALAAMAFSSYGDLSRAEKIFDFFMPLMRFQTTPRFIKNS